MNSKLDQAISYYTGHLIQWNIKWELLYPSIQMPLEHWINVVTKDLQPQYFTIASSSKVFYLQCIHILTVALTQAQQVQSLLVLLSSHHHSNSSNHKSNNKMICENRKRVSIMRVASSI